MLDYGKKINLVVKYKGVSKQGTISIFKTFTKYNSGRRIVTVLFYLPFLTNKSQCLKASVW